MAYTYEDFINAATSAGMLERFDETDLQTAQKSPEYGLSLLSLMGDMDNAQTEEQRLLAGEAAKQLRTSYGTLQQDPAGFVYSKQDQYDQLLNKVTNPTEFQYDVESDPVYGALKKVYLEGGEKATRDTLAKASAGTGGQANSYAIAAAQQAGAEYAGALAKEIPGLNSDAYNKYLAQLSADQSALSQLMTDREAERAQHQQVYNNALGLYQTLGYATPEIAKILGLPDSEVKGSQTGGNTGDLGGNLGGEIGIGAAIGALGGVRPGTLALSIDQEANYNALLNAIQAEKPTYQEALAAIQEAVNYGYISARHQAMLENYYRELYTPKKIQQMAGRGQQISMK